MSCPMALHVTSFKPELSDVAGVHFGNRRLGCGVEREQLHVKYDICSALDVSVNDTHADSRTYSFRWLPVDTEGARYKMASSIKGPHARRKLTQIVLCSSQLLVSTAKTSNLRNQSSCIVSLHTRTLYTRPIQKRCQIWCLDQINKPARLAQSTECPHPESAHI